MGSDRIAVPLLDWLAGEGREIARLAAVFTQPDRPAGRGQKIASSAIKAWTYKHGLPVFQPEKLTDDVRAELAALETDVVLVMAYGHILREEFISAPRLGTLNLHGSLLPKYRGASPIQTAIASGERETGVSLMRIERRLDAGPVADQERVPIAPLDTAIELEAKLAAASVLLLARTLPRLRGSTLIFSPQDDTAASYCRRLEKNDSALEFSASAAVLAARINGLFPWPGCAVELDGQQVKFGLADAVTDEFRQAVDAPHLPGTKMAAVEKMIPGKVLGHDQDGLLIGTGRGVLRVRRLQRPGGRMLPAMEFLRGFPVTVGATLPSRNMRQLVTIR
ncbi:MAG: methionyl-tRNA formyltransferase [Opitutaceae bacterium]|nr:methionyl-tRNA formyltransferase [Opitutaceae bacterium]